MCGGMKTCLLRLFDCLVGSVGDDAVRMDLFEIL
jgi:hypothetical protein